MGATGPAAPEFTALPASGDEEVLLPSADSDSEAMTSVDSERTELVRTNLNS